MPESDSRLPRKRRSIHAPPFRMTKRDAAVVQAVNHYRMLERRQIENLFFTSSLSQVTNTSRARERLRLLYQHSYLERILRPIYPFEGSKGPVYRLGPRGAEFLAAQTGVPISQFHYWRKGNDKDARQSYVHSVFLEHNLAVVDVRIAIEQAVKLAGVQIEIWRDDLDFRHARDWDSVEIVSTGGHKERIPIAPDAYFVLITSQGRGHFFLELDRSTETIQKVWRRKILGYKEYVLSGGFHRRYQVSQSHTALRILTVTPSIERAQNLKEAAERHGSPEVLSIFLFAPMSAIDHRSVVTAPIWLRAGDQRYQAIL